MRDEALASLRALNEVVERLRAPGGCPWDGEQTHASLRAYLLEETYEVLESIDGSEATGLREELGDVLLQVLMHCAIAAEAEGGFDIGDVAETSRAKMIHRHPHVFGDAAVEGAAEVVVNWERLKRSEKNRRLSLLDGIPRSLPALAFAQAVQKRPARLGFDEMPTTAGAALALTEAVARLASLPAAPAEAPPALESAVGELLFAAVALARRLRVNPEDALRSRSNRFADRFRRLETAARAEGVDLHDLDADQWRRRWEAAAGPR
ncbi:MAG: nucleoside triphosphate pyrophosphohydrolase [Candidatus Dormibacteria bacterium]